MICCKLQLTWLGTCYKRHRRCDFGDAAPQVAQGLVEGVLHVGQLPLVALFHHQGVGRVEVAAPVHGLAPPGGTTAHMWLVLASTTRITRWSTKGAGIM